MFWEFDSRQEAQCRVDKEGGFKTFILWDILMTRKMHSKVGYIVDTHLHNLYVTKPKTKYTSFFPVFLLILP